MIKILKINFSETLPSYCEPCNSLGAYFNASDHKGNVIFLYSMSALVCQKTWGAHLILGARGEVLIRKGHCFERDAR